MKDHLSSKELTDAETFWVKTTQLAEFSSEIFTLKAKKELAANSKILMLLFLTIVVSSELEAD